MWFGSILPNKLSVDVGGCITYGIGSWMAVMFRNKWRSEPTDVEKSADEVWLGVKYQSNQELAGSPRNVLRRSGNG